MDFDVYSFMQIVPQTRRVRLGRLAKTMNVNAEVLITLLEQSGYKLLRNKSNIFLDEKHLEIIFRAYLKSVRSLFNNFRKTPPLSRRKKSASYNFLSSFISNPENYTEESISSAELNESLIEEYFYKIVDIADCKFGSKFSRSYISIKIKVTKTFNELRKKTISTFIKYHYYSFSIDEDSERSKSLCFS
jgi:hypothetical protein